MVHIHHSSDHTNGRNLVTAHRSGHLCRIRTHQFDDFRNFVLGNYLPKHISKLFVKGECDSLTGSHLIRGLITKITPIRARVEYFVGCNITHATPRGASVGTRDTRDSSFKFEHAAVTSGHTHRLLIFLGN